MSDAFATAVAAIEATIAAESSDPEIDPRCVSVLLSHGRPMERAIVLFHGFTNCPRQFAALADQFFARGFNVYVPLLPRHGRRDKLTLALAGLSIDELTACARDAAGAVAGLAPRICVLGLSLGATLVAWLAQTQALDRAIAIAPFFSVVHVPSSLEPLVAGALAAAPNAELWWDPRVREHAPPDHAYPRFSTHALAHCLGLGQIVRESADTAAPRTATTTLVLNAKDPAIDNGAARDVLARWRAHGADADEFVFDNLDVRHDIIEPTTYADAPTLVYPVLLRLAAA